MDQIEQVRSKIDIIELINSYIPLKKAGRNFKALCPFHSEKTPSFVVSPERQIFKCFGCGESGNVFNFLMKYENMEFSEALKFLADKAGIKLVSYRPSRDFQEKEKLLQINHLAAEFFHYILLHHRLGQSGRQYLLNRGIRENSIKIFKLGYAPEGWENLINYLVRKKGYKIKQLEMAGLVIKGQKSFYDRFRGRIIFPLADHRNNVVGFSGRTLKADSTGAKYINTPETILYHKSDLFYGLNINKKAIKEKDQAIISEGEFDVISSFQAGVKNIVAIKGSALTVNQIDLIKRFTENIFLSLDHDAAGDAAARRGIEIADKEGLNIRVIELLYGKDPDECSRYSPKLWKKSINKALPVYDFLLKSAVSRFGRKSAAAKKKISEELVPVLAKISNEIVKAHYIKKLAGLLQVKEEAVIKEMEKWEKKESLGYREKKEKSNLAGLEEKNKSRQDKLEELILALILQNSRYLLKKIEKIETGLFKNNVIVRIWEALKKFSAEKNFKKFEINNFVKQLPEELVATIDRLYLLDLQLGVDKKELRQEFKQILNEMKKINLKEQLSILISRIRQLESQGKEKKALAVKQEFIRLSQKIKKLV